MMTPEQMAELAFPLDGSDPATVFECRRRAARMIDVDRYGRDLVEVIAEAIEQRPGESAARAADLIRDTDPDDDLWNNYIGPMLDSLEDDYGRGTE